MHIYERLLELGYWNRKPQQFLVIDFSQGTTEIAYVETIPSGLRLLAYDVQRNMPAQAKNQQALVHFIGEFTRKNLIDKKTVMISISDADSVAIKFITMPMIPDKEIRSAAKWKLRDVVSFDLDQSIIDWQWVDDYTDNEDNRNKGIVFIVAMQHTIDQYLSIVHQCQLEPWSITSSTFSYAHLLTYFPNNPMVSAVLAVDYKGSTLSIYLNNKLNFVRRLPISWEKFTQSLTEVIVSGEDRIELSIAQAEDIESTFGIPESEKEVVHHTLQAAQIISLLRPLLETLVRDLNSSFEYFAANFNSPRPAALYLTGGGSNLKNLDKYLSRELAVPVSYLSAPACVEVGMALSHKTNKTDPRQMANVLGAALSCPGVINLLPSEVRAKRLKQIQREAWRLATVIGGAIFFISLSSAQFQVYHYKNRIKQASDYLETIDKIGVSESNIRFKEDLIKKIQSKRVPVDGVLKVISGFVPQEIILDEFSLDQGKHDLILRGGVMAPEDVAEKVLINFMQQLESSLFFKEVTLISSQRMEIVQRFEISIELHCD